MLFSPINLSFVTGTSATNLRRDEKIFFPPLQYVPQHLIKQHPEYGPKTSKKGLDSAALEFQRLDMPVIFFLGAKSALLIDCYFNETSWYQLRKDIFIRYDWADSHVESIWCKT